MNTVLHTSNTMPRGTMASHPLRNEMKQRSQAAKRLHHHHRSKSCSDVIVSDGPMAPAANNHTTPSHNANHNTNYHIPITNHMTGISSQQPGALAHAYHTPQQQNAMKSTGGLYYHGTKPSLAGFDPFASEGATTRVAGPSLYPSTPKKKSRRHSIDFATGIVAEVWEPDPASPTAETRYVVTSRDSSPTGINNGSISSKSQRQPPPSPLETFSNESSRKHSPATTAAAKAKGSMKRVNKFFRKSGLVKSLSLAHKMGAESSPSKSNKNNTNNSNHASPVSVLQLKDPAPAPENEQPSRVSLSASNKGLSVSVLADQQLSPSAPLPSTTSPTTTPPSLSENAAATTMAQDLMELRDSFRNYSVTSIVAPNSPTLHLPSLTKPRHNYAPTSFLTGQQNSGDHHNSSYEAPVRTSCVPNEPTPFQLEIPSLNEVVTIARLNEFVENYRRQDQNLDPSQFKGLTKQELQKMVDHSKLLNKASAASPAGDNSKGNSLLVQEHVPIIQSLLDCGEHDRETNLRTTAQEGGEISIQGFLTETGDLSADDRTEAVIFQGQRNFTVVFRGTTEQQTKGLVGGSSGSKSKKRAVPLDDDDDNDQKADSVEGKSNNNRCVVEVYSGFKDSYCRVEEECFRQVDKLVDENPFCDVVFSGYSYGGALATLAAFRYAIARPMMRVGCLTLASPKVGFSQFQQAVNNLPNLKVMRLELGRDANCQGPTVGGSHVGHTLVLNSAAPSGTGQGKPSVSVYKFETPKAKNAFFKTSQPGLKKYISTLEDLATLNKNSGKSASSLTWATDFANNAGEGVVVNNEKRLMV
mmetsp:Transcript_8906/g.26446  ORF Transcript_8906/g.26446 Transcript_8906/m.26446 type:complete len:811 (-) Transcript_8906:3784-6216(-)